MKLRVRPLAAAATLLIVGAATATAFWPAPTLRSTAKSFFLSDPEHGVEGWREWPQAEVTAEPDAEGAYADDPRRRMIHNWALFGRPGGEARAQLAREAHREAQRLEAQKLARAQKYGETFAAAPLPTDFGEQWLNVGPTDAEFQWNGSQYLEVDSGRVTSLMVDPSDADGSTLFISTAGGGVWKADAFAQNAAAQDPNWVSISDRIGNQAVGSFAVAPSSPATIYLGTGDPFDTEGGQIIKSTNGGSTWSEPLQLGAQDPNGSGKYQLARTIRDVKVDPANANKVFVATDMGLFMSTDGATFNYVNLENSVAGLMEATWSIAYLGPNRFAVSGVLACHPGRRPPGAGGGMNPGDVFPNIDPNVTEICQGGTPGDIWLTTDGGTTWKSLKMEGKIPEPSIKGAGRITLAAGTPAGDATVIYGMVAARDDTVQVGVWRSTNGGVSFVDATGTVTKALGDCSDPLVGNQQAWYNHAIAVDPADANNVVMGGMLCGMRTRSGLAGAPAWEAVAHWLPSGGTARIDGESVDYVHADWHKASVVRIGSVSRVIVGTDGGISYSDNVFTAAKPTDVLWHGANRGIATHLPYSVGSGDPAQGNPYFLMTGLQDNGTRLRDRSNAEGTFNQVIGGDGLGSAIVSDRAGRMTLFGSVNGRRQYCNPDRNGSGCDEGGAFRTVPVQFGCTGDTDPFLIRYAPAQRDPRGRVVVTASYRRVHRSNGLDEVKFSPISQCLASEERPEASGGHIIRDVSVAPHKDGLFGAALSGGRVAVTSGCVGGATSCEWTVSARLWTDLNANGTREKDESVFFSNDVAFPPGPTGKADGDVYVAVSGAPETEAETPMPAGLGHVFLTTDRGTTFRNIGLPGSGLPNVPAHAAMFDPVDLTNNTLYVGTDLGLYVTRDGGTSWSRVGGDTLPFVKVVDIFLSQSGGMMRVATYGRGLWELHPGAVTETAAGNGDYDRNGHIDFFDVAQLASRLGTTPLDTTQPVYERNLNVNNTGGAALLDDTDLTAVLGMVGEGQP